LRGPSGVQAVESTLEKFGAERSELDSLLDSEILGRGSHPARVLSFVCEQYFQGLADEIKEYNIAVHALGRPADFDPQIDAIVRVTAHALRKRLEHYYRAEGADHAVHIYLPPGRYVPKFVHKAALETSANGAAPADSVAAYEFLRAPGESGTPGVAREPNNGGPESVLSKPHAGTGRRYRAWTVVTLAVVSLCAFIGIALYSRFRAHNSGSQSRLEASLYTPANVSVNAVLAMVGGDRTPYVDQAGRTWGTDTSCTGGTSFSVPVRTILGTWDPQLFLGGRRGLFHCAFAAPAGVYEVHLLFAETADIEETARNVVYSLNGAPSTSLDVVDDAGGDDIATEKIFTDVHPEQDGSIHLDFISADSYLNAVEILPGLSHRMLPLRIYAGHTPYRDSEGELWLPNRYFFGGRASRVAVPDTGSISDGSLSATEWIGHFHYVIPVAPGEKYTVKLHFRESWFHGQNGGTGGVGSRVFDVWCNGTVILKQFDIYKEAGSAPLTKTFPHIEPTTQGKIELYFVPGVNYPSLSAIEVVPE
jgi:hypothetical protein